MANMVVSGAGSTEWNGTYIHTGTYEGKGYYRKDSTHNIFYSMMGYWVIGDEEFMYYAYRGGDTDEYTPENTSWSVQGATPPVPTVTAEQSGTTHEGEVTLSSFSNLRTKKA